MKAWTIQRKERYDILVRDGVLTASWAELFSKLDEYDKKTYGRAYSWLIAQYNKRIGRLRQPPIWLNLQPHTEADLERKSPYILLECDIPSNIALSLDSTNWYDVLSNAPFCSEKYISEPGNNSAYEAEYEYLSKNRKAKRQSWEKVFDLGLGKRGNMYIGAECIVPELRLDWILNTIELPVLTDEEWRLKKNYK